MDLNSPGSASRLEVEAAIVSWREMREVRLDKEKEANKIKESEQQLKGFILEAFKQQKLEGMLIDGRTTGLSVKEIASVTDKEKLIEYIKETGELDLLQFRLAVGAVDERRENGISVPGTEYVDFYDLFDRKV